MIPISHSKENIWEDVLCYFCECVQHEGTGRPLSFNEEPATPYLLRTIDLINKHDILSPIQVLKDVCRYDGLQIGLIRPYLVEKMNFANASLDKNQLLFQSYSKEIQDIKTQIKDLKEK